MTSISDTVSSILSNYYSSTSATSSTDSSSTSTGNSSSTKSNAKLTNTAISRYVSSTSSEDADARTLFKKLSIDLGGDTKEITKDQLDSYVEKIDAGDITVSDEEYDALTTLQENWDDIDEDGDDSIDYTDVVVSGYKDTLLSIVPEDEETTDYMAIAEDATKAAYDKVVAAALGTNVYENDDTTSGFSSLLNTLLSGTSDENDDDNADLIDALTNILASYESTSTIEKEA